MLLSWFCHLRRLVLNKSSPVRPVSEFRGGSQNLTYIGVVVVGVAGQYFHFLILNVHHHKSPLQKKLEQPKPASDTSDLLNPNGPKLLESLKLPGGGPNGAPS